MVSWGVDPVTERATLITTLILRNYIGMVSAFTNTSRKIPATINRIVSIVMTFLRQNVEAKIQRGKARKNLSTNNSTND